MTWRWFFRAEGPTAIAWVDERKLGGPGRRFPHTSCAPKARGGSEANRLSILAKPSGQMRQTFTLFILLLIVSSCKTDKEEEPITGDLFFSAFRIGSYYNLSDSARAVIENLADTTNLASADSGTVKLIRAYNQLKQEGLLYKPFIDLKTGDESFVKLYLDSADYDRIKGFKWLALRERGKKVVVKARTREIIDIDLPLLYCVDLLKVDLVDGETLPGRSKFKIEDYN